MRIQTWCIHSWHAARLCCWRRHFLFHSCLFCLVLCNQFFFLRFLYSLVFNHINLFSGLLSNPPPITTHPVWCLTFVFFEKPSSPLFLPILSWMCSLQLYPGQFTGAIPLRKTCSSSPGRHQIWVAPQLVVGFHAQLPPPCCDLTNLSLHRSWVHMYNCPNVYEKHGPLFVL